MSDYYDFFFLIFLGISFTDEPLRDMLEKYRGQGQHFAIVKSDTEAAERAQQLGICYLFDKNS